ncbi:MAG TPA: hypothetical protein VN281_08720 [Verrucomicrobiae bacterium]|nr:hypothetical protein [Verrucomicrobiae bacterium]
MPPCNRYSAGEANVSAWADDILEFGASGNGSVFASTGSGYVNPLGLAFDSANNLYVSCAGNFIDRFDANGNGGFFASTDNGPWMLAVQPVPEPQAWTILLLCAGVLICRKRSTGGA